MAEKTLRPMGRWNKNSSYETLDVVEHNGSSFIAKQDSRGKTPRATGEHFMLLAQRGKQGKEGLMGPAGSKCRRGAPAE